MGNKEVFNYDMQGWPKEKQLVRDFLKAIGAKLEDGVWSISDDNPVLDSTLRKLNDDGMGYGVHEEFVECIGTVDDYCNVFTDVEDKKIKLWEKGKFRPGCCVCDIRKPESKENSYIVVGIEEKNNELVYECMGFDDKKANTIDIEEKYLKFF